MKNTIIHSVVPSILLIPKVLPRSEVGLRQHLLCTGPEWAWSSGHTPAAPDCAPGGNLLLGSLSATTRPTGRTFQSDLRRQQSPDVGR